MTIQISQLHNSLQPTSRVLHFYSYDFIANPWLGGGGAYRDIEILSRMAKHFDKICLYVGSYPGAKRHTLRGIEVFPLGFGRKEWVSRIAFVLGANWNLLCRSQGFTGIALSIYAPFICAWLHRQRTFGVLHHIIGANWSRKLGSFGSWIHRLEMFYYRLPQIFVVVNPSVRETLLRQSPKARVLASSNAIDSSLFALPDTSASRAPFLLFLGRLDPFMKGLDLLVKAFAKVAANFPELNLVLAGHGDPASEAEILALARQFGLENRITLRKDVSNQEKQDLLSECLFFCSPSRFEGFGIAVLEASAAGKAVLVSEASGFLVSVSQGYSGLRVSLEDEQALHLAMHRLVSDGELRAKLGRQGREWARGFSWDAIAEKEAAWLSREMGWGHP